MLFFTVKYEVYFTLLNSRTQLINLGNACKNMWKAAGNNLITLAGPNQELKVEITAANPLFTVELGGGGPAKIASLPFTRFHGNGFLSFASFIFFKLTLLANLSLIDESQQFSLNFSRPSFLKFRSIFSILNRLCSFMVY